MNTSRAVKRTFIEKNDCVHISGHTGKQRTSVYRPYGASQLEGLNIHVHKE